MIGILKKYRYVLILALIFSICVINGYVILSKTPTYDLSYDQANHLREMVLFSSRMDSTLAENAAVFTKTKNILDLFNVAATWPRFVYFITYLEHKIFGQGIFVSEMGSLVLYVFLLLIGIYFIGKKLAGPFCGAVAALIVLCCPKIAAYSLGYGFDFPLTAFVVLSICLLLYSDNFRKLNMSILFGVVFGLGILVKGQIIFFVLGPLLYFICVTPADKQRRNSIMHLIIALLAAGIISSVWWYSNIKALFDLFIWHVEGARGYPVFINIWFLYYFAVLIEEVPFVLYPLFVFGVFHLIKSRSKDGLVFGLWMIGSYIILSLLHDKEPRFYLPALPAVAVVCAYGVSRFAHRQTKIIIISIIVFLFISGQVYFYQEEREFTNYDDVADIFAAAIKKHSDNDRHLGIGIIDLPYTYKPARSIQYLLCKRFPQAQIYRYYKEHDRFPGHIPDMRYLMVIIDKAGDVEMQTVLDVIAQKKDMSVKQAGALIGFVHYDIREIIDKKQTIATHRIPSEIMTDSSSGPSQTQYSYENEAQLLQIMDKSGKWEYIKRGVWWPDEYYIYLFKAKDDVSSRSS